MFSIEKLIKCGYFDNATNKSLLSELLDKDKITFYIGFDGTANSLHIGSLMPIMLIRYLQKLGHQPVILIGGATTKIGDPTGKDKIRQKLSDQIIDQNIKGIEKSLRKFINFDTGDNKAILVNNSTWFNEIKYLDFLRDFGPLFSINKMLTMDSVRLRLEREQSLTFLEFNYMLLQAYDFYHLYKNYNCTLQIGGQDQWGNIIFGVDLIKKLCKTNKNYSEPLGLTTPLLLNSAGIKMGKSLGGAVWLNEDKLSSYDYFQYWRNIDDKDILRFARLYCEFSDEEYDMFEHSVKQNINAAKKHLAYVITSLCHGENEAIQASKKAENIFEKKQIDTSMINMTISKAELQDINFCSLVVMLNITNSKSKAKNLIKEKAVKLNDVIINDPYFQLQEENFINHIMQVTAGKKRCFFVKLTQ